MEAGGGAGDRDQTAGATVTTNFLKEAQFEELEKSAQTAIREGFARIQPKTAGIILHTENTVLRYAPELSIRPEAQKADNKE